MSVYKDNLIRILKDKLGYISYEFIFYIKENDYISYEGSNYFRVTCISMKSPIYVKIPFKLDNDYRNLYIMYQNGLGKSLTPNIFLRYVFINFKVIDIYAYLRNLVIRDDFSYTYYTEVNNEGTDTHIFKLVKLGSTEGVVLVGQGNSYDAGLLDCYYKVLKYKSTEPTFRFNLNDFVL